MSSLFRLHPVFEARRESGKDTTWLYIMLVVVLFGFGILIGHGI